MIRVAFSLAGLGMLAITATAFAGAGARTGINGSLHDINAQPGYLGDSLGRTCVFCHTPHNARNTDALVPLWNHAESRLPVLTAYVWKAPANAQFVIGNDPLIGPSRLCMSCHDGTTAVDSHGGANSFGSYGATPMTSSYTDALGATATRYITDLTVTHPIGFLYDDVATRRGMAQIIPSQHGYLRDVPVRDTWDTSYGSAARITAGETEGKIRDSLYNGYLTCTSCHEVHNSRNALPEPGNSYNYFLRAKLEGSAICLSCHVK
jgi:hypothetical protein